MLKRLTAIFYSAAAVCGAIYTYVLAEVFGRLLVPNPLNHWLIEKLAKTGHEAEYNAVIYSHDLSINVLMALPFALLVSLLPPGNSWKYLMAALGTSLVLQYWPVIIDLSTLSNVSKLWHFYVGLGISVFGFPLAFAAVLAVRNRVTRTL